MRLPISMRRPTPVAALIALGWLPPLVLDVTLGQEQRPFLLFVPYLLPALWLAPLPLAWVAAGITIGATTLLDIGTHGDPPLYLLVAVALIVIVSAGTVALRLRIYAMQERLRTRLKEREEMIRALTEAQRQAEEALRLRDDFLVAASHDLRTPLTVIMGRASVMQMRLARAGTLEPAWLGQQINALARSGQRLTRLVEGMTDAAALQSGQPLELRLEQLDLREIVAGVASLATEVPGLWGPLALSVEASDAPLIVEADRGRLESMLQHLVDNAVSFSPGGASVCIAVAREGDWARIEVRDKGIGIPPDDLPRIFQRYYRASNVAPHHSGTGIGLATTRAIVEQHGGHMSAASTLGEGATIALLLHLARTSTAEAVAGSISLDLREADTS